jgi:hypothetical protein
MTEEQVPEEEPEVEWIPVVKWPAEARELVTDIEKIRHVMDQMAGTADDLACQVLVNFLQAALLARQRELALTVLGKHGVELPEPGSVPTPQERMSAMLAHIGDEVRQRRPDLVPDKQPPTDRARHHLPDMKT